MRIYGENLCHKTKPFMVHKRPYQSNISFEGEKKADKLSNAAYAMLFLSPLIFANPSLKSQNRTNPEQYINIQIGEKDTKKKDFDYYHNDKYDHTDSVIRANGKIEHFKQGSLGDCAVLDVAKAVGLTQKGKQIIREYVIQPAPDGSFQVELCNDSDAITVSRKDFFAEENKNLSTGDDDAKIIEIAFKKDCDSRGEPYEFAPTDALRLLTCALPDYAIRTEDSRFSFIDDIGDEKVVDSNTGMIYELLELLMEMDSERAKNAVLILSTKDKNVKFGLYENHAYYVTNVKLRRNKNEEIEGIFEINDPHCTSCKPVKLDITQLLESMNGVDFLEL